MTEVKTQIKLKNILEFELSEEDLMTVVGGAKSDNEEKSVTGYGTNYLSLFVRLEGVGKSGGR